MHDWYGVYNITCPGKGFCGVSNAGGGGTNFSNFRVKPPAETDYTGYHKFGFLWVPATATAQGYAQYFFDGTATDDKITWDQYTRPASPTGENALDLWDNRPTAPCSRNWYGTGSAHDGCVGLSMAILRC